MHIHQCRSAKSPTPPQACLEALSFGTHTRAHAVQRAQAHGNNSLEARSKACLEKRRLLVAKAMHSTQCKDGVRRVRRDRGRIPCRGKQAVVHAGQRLVTVPRRQPAHSHTGLLCVALCDGRSFFSGTACACERKDKNLPKAEVIPLAQHDTQSNGSNGRLWGTHPIIFCYYRYYLGTCRYDDREPTGIKSKPLPL